MKYITIFLLVGCGLRQPKPVNNSLPPLVDTTIYCDRTIVTNDALCITAFWEEKKIRIIRVNHEKNRFDTIWINK